MKQLIIIITILIVLSISKNVFSSENQYTMFNIGEVSSFNSDIEPEDADQNVMFLSRGNSVNFSIGYIYDFLRVEVEYFQSKNDIDAVYELNTFRDISGSLETRAIFFNVYLNHKTKSNWSPYIGFGLGEAEVYINNAFNNDIGMTVVDDKDIAFAYQAKLGVSIKIFSNLLLNVNYRYLWVNTISIFSISSQSEFIQEGPKQRLIEFGVRLNF